MKYVLDSSVAFKWIVADLDSDKAERLRDDCRNGVHQLVAPDFFLSEVGHSLTRAERQKRIKVGNAVPLLAEVLQTCPAFYATFPLLFRACAISSQMRVGMYDCTYVALAEQEACEFITADEKLLKNLQPTFPFIVPLSSLP